MFNGKYIFKGSIFHCYVSSISCGSKSPKSLREGTPPKFNSSPLKNGGWKTILSYWVSVTLQGRTVKLREGNGNPPPNANPHPPMPTPTPQCQPPQEIAGRTQGLWSPSLSLNNPLRPYFQGGMALGGWPYIPMTIESDVPSEGVPRSRIFIHLSKAWFLCMGNTPLQNEGLVETSKSPVFF